MEVDRSRFLLLTAALALAACNKETETKQDEKAKEAPAAEAKEAPAADKKEPEPEAKEFGVKGAPEPSPDGNALPPIEPEPEEVPAPSPIKE
ncbi:hypothetical protein DB30_06244 [Enhygromyxa salina]|uniref:Lipoprotein n=1 Tax=Enhygromyxa salina TaxID=215803 RepID=A0A0C2D438_9BACT|nr:hypothetical protein [Enhygromyxa salina]KIG14862.1 hypothetical protein DB30_06244 [Enhygromyxa salina]